MVVLNKLCSFFNF